MPLLAGDPVTEAHWENVIESYLSLCKWFQIISDSIFTQVAFLG